MQFILTEEEFKALVEKAEKAQSLDKDILQDLCTKVADHMPVKYWGRETAEPWKCIHSVEEEWYCDECPVTDVCPSIKRWSK